MEEWEQTLALITATTVAAIPETKMNKGIQTICKGMRAKVELNYCGESIKQNVCSFQIEPLFISNISSALR